MFSQLLFCSKAQDGQTLSQNAAAAPAGEKLKLQSVGKEISVGASQVSYLMFPRSSLEPEVVLVRHVADRSKALICALSDEERGGISEDP